MGRNKGSGAEGRTALCPAFASGYPVNEADSGVVFGKALADEHDDREGEQVPEVAHLVADEAGDDHEDRAADGERRNDVAA